MPSQIWSVAGSVDVEDDIDALARRAAEKIREEQLEAERKLIASMIHRALGFHSHGNPAYVGSYNDEELLDFDTDEWKPGRFQIPCRGCRRTVSPLCSKSRVVVDSGWRWRGISHQEPEVDYFFACGWCGTPMLFTLVTPQ